MKSRTTTCDHRSSRFSVRFSVNFLLLPRVFLQQLGQVPYFKLWRQALGKDNQNEVVISHIDAKLLSKCHWSLRALVGCSGCLSKLHPDFKQDKGLDHRVVDVVLDLADLKRMFKTNSILAKADKTLGTTESRLGSF